MEISSRLSMAAIRVASRGVPALTACFPRHPHSPPHRGQPHVLATLQHVPLVVVTCCGVAAAVTSTRFRMTALPSPKRVLQNGEEVKVSSDSSDKQYTVKRVDDHFSCQCPAWRMQKGVGVDARSCKHIRGLVGDAYENARLALKGKRSNTPPTPSRAKRTAAAGSTGTVAKKVKGKARPARDGDDGEENDGGAPVSDADGEPKKVELLLAHKFDLNGKRDPTGWWISEKLDGIRAYWDGQGKLWSRLGNQFFAPAWFIRKLPRGHTLDGELFHSRGNFSAASSIVRSHASEKWNEIRFKAFDIPSLAHLPFETRVTELKKLFPSPVDLDAPKAAAQDGGSEYKWVKGPIVEVVEQVECKGLSHLLDMLKEVEQDGGEGLMLREPKSLYVGKRSNTLLKVKTFFDAEARVTGYEPGKGKYKGMTGSLICQMESGKTFSCGSGLTDAQRTHPPKMGAIISYRFQEVTKDGVPRFPTFAGERVDVAGPKDADVSKKTVKA